MGIGVAVLAGCAHPRTVAAPAPAPEAACQGYEIQRAWLRAGPVYSPCDVDEQATATLRTPTGYHPVDCQAASATALLVVSAEGVPEPRTITVVHSTSEAFGKAVTRALRAWRYTPAVKGGRKVRQVARQQFQFQCQQVPQGR